MAALGTRSLQISVAATDYTAQVFNVDISSEAADDSEVTYAEAAAGGGRVYTLNFTAYQDMTTGTLWDKVWASAGTSAAVIIKPYGNAAASTTQPHYTGNVTITEPDGVLIGGEANSSATARQKFEASWVFAAKPTKVTA